MCKRALDIEKLTPDEKCDLIDFLWSSFSSDDLALTPEVRAKLDRRLDRLDREGPAGFDWEDVRAEMTDDW